MTERNYDTISPSAKMLLIAKAMTSIPFARAAATMVWTEDWLREQWSKHANPESFAWLLHFENRYRTINGMLPHTGTNNYLEISSGYSFRGLEMCREQEVMYIDTDLPASMETKKQLVGQLIDKYAVELKGILLMEPLNALDETAFNQLMDRFPPGPVTILNEGLLMYLDETEKRRLCGIVHDALARSGGCWITGDVYIKNPKQEPPKTALLQEARNFLAAHQVEEKKFDSFEAAEAFFDECGFMVAQKEIVAYEQLSALRFIEDKNIPAETVKSWFRNRQTWKLMPK